MPPNELLCSIVYALFPKCQGLRHEKNTENALFPGVLCVDSVRAAPFIRIFRAKKRLPGDFYSSTASVFSKICSTVRRDAMRVPSIVTDAVPAAAL